MNVPHQTASNQELIAPTIDQAYIGLEIEPEALSISLPDDFAHRAALYVVWGPRILAAELAPHWPAINIAGAVLAPEDYLTAAEQKALVKHMSSPVDPSSHLHPELSDQQIGEVSVAQQRAARAELDRLKRQKKVDDDHKTLLLSFLRGTKKEQGGRYGVTATEYAPIIEPTRKNRALTWPTDQMTGKLGPAYLQMDYDQAISALRAGLEVEAKATARQDSLIALTTLTTLAGLIDRSSTGRGNAVLLADYKNAGILKILTQNGLLPEAIAPQPKPERNRDDLGMPEAQEDSAVSRFYNRFDFPRSPAELLIDARTQAVIRLRAGQELSPDHLAQALLAEITVGVPYRAFENACKTAGDSQVSIALHHNRHAIITHVVTDQKMRAMMEFAQRLPDPRSRYMALVDSYARAGREYFDSL